MESLEVRPTVGGLIFLSKNEAIRKVAENGKKEPRGHEEMERD